MTIFNNILKEKDKFSQGRVYLFLSIFVYYMTQGIILITAFFNFDVDVELMKSVADAVEYPMTTFATYTLGGKAVELLKKQK